MLTWATLKDAGKQFAEDQLTDWAAALTYYGILALFPGLHRARGAARPGRGVPADHERAAGRSSTRSAPARPRRHSARRRRASVKAKGGAGALFGIGLVAAMWSASGYIGAFMRASNAIYEVEEGRPFWKLRPMQLVRHRSVMVLLLAAAAGRWSSPARWPGRGRRLGLGDTAVRCGTSRSGRCWSCRDGHVRAALPRGAQRAAAEVPARQRGQHARRAAWLVASAGSRSTWRTSAPTTRPTARWAPSSCS